MTPTVGRVVYFNNGTGDSAGKWDWMPYQKQKAEYGNHNSESAEPRPN